MQDRLKCKIAIFERRYDPDQWEFIQFIENNDKYGVTTKGNVMHESGQSFCIHLPREKTPKNAWRTMEAIQCTGLKDKNGKLIYEKDILLSPDVDEPYMVIVEWDDEKAGYIIKVWIGKEFEYALSDDEIEDLKYFEIIGNIYENPELLEVKC